MVAEVRSMRDEIINKKQKTRHIDGKVQASDRGSDRGNLPATAEEKENRFIDCITNQKIPDMRTMTGIRQRYIRVFTWLLDIFNPDTNVIHDNRHHNLFGLSWQADMSNLDILEVSGERRKGPYEREFIHTNTITMNGDWLRDESNYDTIKKNCDWIMGPSNREMHAMDGNRDTVTIISANMTCWARHAETVLAMKADALVLQETRLTRLTQVRATRKAAFQGHDVVWGQGMRQMETLRGKNLAGNEALRKNRLCTAVSVSSRTRIPYLACLQLVPRMAQQRLWPRVDGICVRSFFTAPICTWNRNLTHQRKLARSE